MLAIISQALKCLSISFLDCLLSLLVSFLWKSWHKHWIIRIVYAHFPMSDLPPVCLFFQTRSWFWLVYHHPHTHTTNFAIFWRGTWHICFASASLSYLAVISPLSFLLNVCMNTCYVCFFAPMPCATLMESAIHCMITQLATHTHQPTLLSYFFPECLTISWLFHWLYVCLMFAHTEWFQNRNVAFIQIHVLWKVV